MSYTKKVAYNTLAQMIGKVVGVAVSIATVAALFRYFGIEGVGKYTTVFAFVAFFSIFADFGLQWTLLRELSVNSDKNKVFRNIFAFRLFIALLVHALAFGVVWFFNYPLDVKYGVGIITFAWFFTTMNSTLVGVFLNSYRLDISVSTDIVGRIAILLLTLYLISIKSGFSVILAATLAGNALNFLLNLIFVRRYIKLGMEFDFKYWPHIFSQALPIGIVLIFHFIYFRIDSLMLSLMKGMADVGIYGTAYKLLEVLETVPSMFLGAAFPLVTRYVVKKDERMHSAFQKQFDFLFLIAVPIVGGTYVLASPIINFLGGRGGEFTSASTVSVLGNPSTAVTCLRILIFAVGVSFFSNLYTYLIVSLGRQKNMVWPTIGFAVFNVVLNLIVIPRFSYVGASFSTLLTEFVVVAVSYFVAMKFLPLKVSLANSGKILIAGLIMTFFALYFNSVGTNLFVNIAMSAALYTGLIFLFKAVPMELVRSIIKR
jgi:O-antigen/teichoic acid export membrane protein